MLADWSDDDFRSLHAHLLRLGHGHTVADAHPACRRLARTYMRHVFTALQVAGTDHLRRAMDDGPTVIVTNHLSYIDAMAMDSALAWAGHADLADRIVYLAGPKVYAELFRLMAAASIHNLPVPQSNTFDHTEPIPPRELARRVRASLDASQAALDAHRAILLYPEGSRSRTGRLGSFLQATRRYVGRGARLVPAAVVGTQVAMPMDAQVLHRTPLALTIAPAIDLETTSPRDALTRAHAVIADLLPPDLQPAKGTEALC
jgi:1-acyl-sn-glycerol-3-phosphate acyltransferase